MLLEIVFERIKTSEVYHSFVCVIYIHYEMAECQLIVKNCVNLIKCVVSLNNFQCNYCLHTLLYYSLIQLAVLEQQTFYTT